MRITIEYTDSNFCKEINPSISVESERDDLSIQQVCGLVRMALIGAGYHPDTVNKVLPDKFDLRNTCEPSEALEMVKKFEKCLDELQVK